MSNTSPLGQYAPLVAAGSAALIIAAYVAALLLGGALGVTPEGLDGLQNLALLAVGVVFGTAATVNGWKRPVEAAHRRLDEIGAPPADKVAG